MLQQHGARGGGLRLRDNVSDGATAVMRTARVATPEPKVFVRLVPLLPAVNNQFVVQRRKEMSGTLQQYTVPGAPSYRPFTPRVPADHYQVPITPNMLLVHPPAPGRHGTGRFCRLL